jgi:cytidylate kinase
MRLQLHRLPFDEAVTMIAAHVHTATALVGSTRVIAIDGPAGAGKSTIARDLAPRLGDAPIVQMDDLYRGWADALTPNLTATLRDQILRPIGLGKSGGYRRWDWRRDQLGESVDIPRHEFLILEGVGASQRVVRPYASTMVWIDIKPSEGLSRVLDRDGELVADLEEFTRQMRSWQGSELLHFQRENTFDAAHLRFDGSALSEGA